MPIAGTTVVIDGVTYKVKLQPTLVAQPAPPPPPPPPPTWPTFLPEGPITVQPIEVNQVVERLGVNLHLGGGVYSKPIVRDALMAIGIRRCRTNVAGLWSAAEQFKELGELGVRFTIVGNLGRKGPDIVKQMKAIGPQYFFAMEGLNEWDKYAKRINERPNWIEEARNYQKELFAAFKADPDVSHIKVLSTSPQGIQLDTSPQAIGNIDEWIDGFSCHRYPGANNLMERPDFLGKLKTLSHMGDLTKPVFLTESGYSKDVVSEETDAITMPRLYLWALAHGLALVSKYELLDEGGVGFEGRFGYVFTDGRLTKAALAVTNLLTLLSDPGPRHQTTPLQYTLDGDLTRLVVVPFQKRDGTHILAMWYGVTGTKRKPVAVQFPAATAPVLAEVASPHIGATWAKVGITNKSVLLNITEQVLLLKLQ